MVEPIIYIDLMTYKETIQEDMVQPDDIIRYGNEYKDEIDTRKFLLYYTKQIAKKIETLPCVRTAWAKTASQDTEKGLSNYITIIFKHPKNLNQEDIDYGYTFKLRLSDHGHEDARQYRDIIDSTHIVGMKAKNMEKAAIRMLKTNLSNIQELINDFEITKFGRPVTKFDI